MRIIYISLIFLTSCVNPSINARQDSVENNLPNNTKQETASIKDNVVSCGLVNNSSLWKVDIDKDGKEYLIKGDSIEFIKDDLTKIIYEINKNSKVQLKLIKTHNNIIYVKIINSTYFTQSIGDTGAEWYLASVVFSLTENGKNNYVDFDFQEGDAGVTAGKKKRGDFLNDYKICE